MNAPHRWDWKQVHRIALREARAVLGYTPDAEDAAQEAAIRIWRRRATCRGAPVAWIRVIARNEALRVAGRRREQAPLDAVADVAGEERVPPASPEVRAAMADLPHDDRLLLLLRYWADLTQPELARAIEMPEGTVKVRLHRARQRLRVALD